MAVDDCSTSSSSGGSGSASSSMEAPGIPKAGPHLSSVSLSHAAVGGAPGQHLRAGNLLVTSIPPEDQDLPCFASFGLKAAIQLQTYAKSDSQQSHGDSETGFSPSALVCTQVRRSPIEPPPPPPPIHGLLPEEGRPNCVQQLTSFVGCRWQLVADGHPCSILNRRSPVFCHEQPPGIPVFLVS